ncbi:MAG: hypothetical protein DMD72_01725, partial [Gemmatimonadetes bacterium]
MKRRTFVQRGVVGAFGFGVLRKLEALKVSSLGQRVSDPLGPGGDTAVGSANEFTTLRDRYFLFQLARNPVTSTYLGGDAYDPSLRDINSRLRDYSRAALMSELRYYTDTRNALSRINPRALSAAESVDRALMDAQLEFLIRQLGGSYEQRSLDSYVAEPFRGIDWQIQQMTDAGRGLLGTEVEWQQVVNRALATPRYLETARTNLLSGKRA